MMRISIKPVTLIVSAVLAGRTGLERDSDGFAVSFAPPVMSF